MEYERSTTMFGADEKKNLLPLNLQFFADKEEDDNEDVDNEDVEDQGDQDGTGKDSDKDNKDKDKGDKGNKDTKIGGKTFTQAQVTRMMTKEKNQGREAALRELGIDPKDSKMVNMMKAFIESQKTDEQKDAEKQSQEQAKIKEAEERALKAEAKAEAMLLGVKSQYVEDVVALALTKMTDDADLKTLIGEYKTKYPMWFGKESEEEDDKGSKTKGQKGTGSSVKATGKDKKNEEKSLGARLAAQRKGTAKKSSYWGK